MSSTQILHVMLFMSFNDDYQLSVDPRTPRVVTPSPWHCKLWFAINYCKPRPRRDVRTEPHQTPSHWASQLGEALRNNKHIRQPFCQRGKPTFKAYWVCLLCWIRRWRDKLCCSVQMWGVLCCLFLWVIAQLESSCPPHYKDYCWIHTQEDPSCPCILSQSVNVQSQTQLPATFVVCVSFSLPPRAWTICWANSESEYRELPCSPPNALAQRGHELHLPLIITLWRKGPQANDG